MDASLSMFGQTDWGSQQQMHFIQCKTTKIKIIIQWLIACGLDIFIIFFFLFFSSHWNFFIQSCLSRQILTILAGFELWIPNIFRSFMYFIGPSPYLTPNLHKALDVIGLIKIISSEWSWTLLKSSGYENGNVTRAGRNFSFSFAKNSGRVTDRWNGNKQ